MGEQNEDQEYDAQWVSRIKARCTITESGCWLWPGSVSYNGYGQTSYRAKNCVIHRKMYEIANGVALDRWIYACHSCDVRNCANPAHIFTGTPRENQIDMSRKRRAAGQLQTHCKNGHEFTPENTYWGNRGMTKVRHCRTCSRIRQRMAALGWTKEQATTLPVTPKGHRPVAGKQPQFG